MEDPSLTQGLYAYTEQQANALEMLATNFVQKWVPLLKKHGADTLWAGQYHTSGDGAESDSEEDDREDIGGSDKGKEKEKDDDDIFDSYELDD